MPLNAPSVRLAAQRGHCFVYLYILDRKQRVRVAHYGIRGKNLEAPPPPHAIRGKEKTRRIHANLILS